MEKGGKLSTKSLIDTRMTDDNRANDLIPMLLGKSFGFLSVPQFLL